MSRLTSLTRLSVIVAALAVGSLANSDLAEAKVGGGASMGSRGTRTFSAPPMTRTVPRAAAPIQKSITQPSRSTAAATVGRPSLFGGLRGLLLGGLVVGALASIFGTGVFAHLIGFILQAALIGGLGLLAYNYFTGRRGQSGSRGGSLMDSMAAARANYGASSQTQPAYAQRTAAMGSGGTAPVSITPEDFNAFEKLLGDIQLAYGRGDTGTLAELVTPEMLSYFTGDLNANTAKGLRNEISEPKLLQGDLAEAWQEASGDYASVAMRFTLLDRMVDTATGRIVSGSTSVPTQSTELWTFRRPINGRPSQWALSAIQQG